MQAIKCHVALTARGKQLPAIEVESQVALARLLMAHTQNTQEARQRLERAVSPFLPSTLHAFPGLMKKGTCAKSYRDDTPVQISLKSEK